MNSNARGATPAEAGEPAATLGMEDVQSTAVVVGAGIIGIACAHYLSQAGWRVTVLDRGQIANACSQGNCGYICPSHVLPLTEPGAFKVAMKSLFKPDAPFRVKPRFSPALWRWMFEFARRCTRRQMLDAGKHLQEILDSSMREYRRLVVDERLDCQWRDSGLLYVMRTQHGLDEFSHADRILSDHFGVRARRIEGAELTSLEPALRPGLAGAYLYPGDSFVRPDRLAASWSERLRERGVRFLENCEFQGLQRVGNRVVGVRTSLGEMRAERYVIAAGAWSALLERSLGCSIPIQPGKGYSVTMARPEPCPTYPMLFPEHKVGVTPFRDGYRLGSMMEFAGYDTSIPERRIQQLRDSASHYLLAPHTDDVQQTWYGWRPMTWDSLPIIGPAPGLDNVLLATGHNMLGMSLATATGRLVAELITGQTPHIAVEPFSPRRFQ